MRTNYRTALHTATSIGLSIALAIGTVLVAGEAADAATTRTSIVTQPQSVTWERGNTATFTVKAAGTSLSYRWYVKKSSSGTWKVLPSSVSGVRSASLKLKATAARNGYKLRVVVAGKKGTVTSKAVTFTTVAATTSIRTQPASIRVTSGNTATFTAAATAKTPLTYHWYTRRSSSAAWTSASSASKTATTLTVAANYSPHNGRQYKVVVTSKTAAISSKVATLTVVPTKITITSNIASATISKYGSGTTSKKLSVTADGAGLRYQWKYLSPGTTVWQPISGATDSSYTVTAGAWASKTSFRLDISGLNGTASSSVATITILSPSNTPAADAEKKYGLTGVTQGVDLSAYQYSSKTKIKMAAVNKWGDFSILRAGTGALPISTGYTNRCTDAKAKTTSTTPAILDCAYDTLSDQATTQKLKLGHYWFNGWIRGIDSGVKSSSGKYLFSGGYTATESATQYVAWLIKYGNYSKTDTDPLVLDVESGSTYTATYNGKQYTLTQRAWNAKETATFLRVVKSTLTAKGYKANLYVYMSEGKANKRNSDASYYWKSVAAIARLWVASWSSNNGQLPSSQPSPGPWAAHGGWSIWQYTSNAIVSGSNVGRLDANIAKSDAWTVR